MVREGSLVRTRFSLRGPGVLSGFVFQRSSPEDTTLVGSPIPFLKVGIISLQIGLQIDLAQESVGASWLPRRYPRRRGVTGRARRAGACMPEP